MHSLRLFAPTPPHLLLFHPWTWHKKEERWWFRDDLPRKITKYWILRPKFERGSLRERTGWWITDFWHAITTSYSAFLQLRGGVSGFATSSATVLPQLQSPLMLNSSSDKKKLVKKAWTRFGTCIHSTSTGTLYGEFIPYMSNKSFHEKSYAVFFVCAVCCKDLLSRGYRNSSSRPKALLHLLVPVSISALPTAAVSGPWIYFF